MTKTHIYFNDVWTISTHTLTWSVTPRVSGHIRYTEFQLTRSRGAWPKGYCYCYAKVHFNSHAHVERDQGLVCPQEPWIYFNSHAHVERDMVLVLSISFDRVFQLTRSRGAWLNFLTMKCISPKFQLTRSRGAWPGITKTQNHHYIFQLTRSRGAWHNQYHTASYLCHFNSHAHVERDSQLSVKMSGAVISTHTLTWSVTICFEIFLSHRQFQLTRSRGAWRQWQILRDSLSHFNSHAHVERDPRRTGKYAESWNFNSHAHVERDAEKDKLCKEFVISTHTLTWSVTEEFESLI